MSVRATALILLLAASSLAWGETLDPPERLANLSYVEGAVTFEGAHSPATSTLPDRPLAPGDRLVTERDGRAELAFGTATIRLDEDSELSIVDLDSSTVRIELNAGTASIYLLDLLEDESFEIVTPNATIALIEPGEYRVDINSDDVSALTVRNGAAEIATAGGPVQVAGNQRVRLEGRDALARLESPRPSDEFDDWVLEREVRLADQEPPRYTPFEGGGYQELDRYGEWYDEPRYGRVWMPAYGYSGWSPYRGGYWQRAGYGWSWYDPAPWGFFTYYSGRWAYLPHRNRWCWVPESRHHERRFAHEDTRPFGRPRGGWNERDRHDRDEPRDNWQNPRREEPRRPVAGLDRGTPPVHAEPRPTQQIQAAREERLRRGVYRRNVTPAQSPPPRIVDAPRGGNVTMRPVRAAEARALATPERTQGRREFGARREP